LHRLPWRKWKAVTPAFHPLVVGRRDLPVLSVAKLTKSAAGDPTIGAFGFVDHASTEPDECHAYPQ
jgi:hypothetical protein